MDKSTEFTFQNYRHDTGFYSDFNLLVTSDLSLKDECAR
jgi:hypothetical protein